MELDELGKAFEAFKTHNDARLNEIAKFGEASAATQAAVERANADIAAIQAKLKEANDKTELRMNELEDRIVRNATRGRGEKLDDDFRERYAIWQGVVQAKLVDPADLDMGFVDKYRKDFRAYIRRGISNDLSVVGDESGGYWVDPDTSGRIVEFVRESSPVRQYASVQATTSDSLEGSYDMDEAGDGGWVGETETRSDTTTPIIGEWSIPVREQYAQPKATQKVLDDAAVNVEAWLAGKIGSKFARREATAFVTGNGEKKPRGFLTYPSGDSAAGDATAIQKIAQVNSGNASALTADGLTDLVYSQKSALRAGSIFGGTRLTEAAIRKLKDTTNNYLWRPDFTQAGSSMLMGFPFVEFADMPEIAANALPLFFGNLRAGYQIVDRIGIRTLRDPYTSKPYVKFYTTQRVGGDVIDFSAIKLQKIST
ncbi:MAG: phage major capsid protein [Dehalococcoidia bacterium]|nr:phage major capsid protein [Dehalococcoidia bacterium]